MATAEDLTRAIGQAKKDKDFDLAAKLEKKLDALLDTVGPSPAPVKGAWIDEVEGLGSVKVESSILPKRSSRELQQVSDYFDEGAKQYAEDDQRLLDMIGDGVEDFE